MKRIKCNHCGKTKTENNFYRRSDGSYQVWCKECRSAYGSSASNKGRRSESYARRKEEIRLRHLAQEKVLVTEKYCGICERTLSAEKFSKSIRTPDNLQTRCKECVAAYHKKYVSIPAKRRHKLDYDNAFNKLPASRNRRFVYKKRRRARKYGAEGCHTKQEWIDLCNKYGNRCLCCGQVKELTEDHVIPISKNGSDHISNIQPLCMSCNQKKRINCTDYRGEWNETHSPR